MTELQKQMHEEYQKNNRTGRRVDDAIDFLRNKYAVSQDKMLADAIGSRMYTDEVIRLMDEYVALQQHNVMGRSELLLAFANFIASDTANLNHTPDEWVKIFLGKQ